MRDEAPVAALVLFAVYRTRKQLAIALQMSPDSIPTASDYYRYIIFTLESLTDTISSYSHTAEAR
jgi:hypothetical protein